MLLLERGPSISKSGSLLLELDLDLLAGGALLPELLLHREKRGGLSVKGGL
jgi:hypothetical protein